MNKQPFYHHCGILFTATEELEPDEVLKIITDALQHKLRGRIVRNTVEYDDPLTSEPGDPADLL